MKKEDRNFLNWKARNISELINDTYHMKNGDQITSRNNLKKAYEMGYQYEN